MFYSCLSASDSVLCIYLLPSLFIYSSPPLVKHILHQNMNKARFVRRSWKCCWACCTVVAKDFIAWRYGSLKIIEAGWGNSVWPKAQFGFSSEHEHHGRRAVKEALDTKKEVLGPDSRKMPTWFFFSLFSWYKCRRKNGSQLAKWQGRLYNIYSWMMFSHCPPPSCFAMKWITVAEIVSSL